MFKLITSFTLFIVLVIFIFQNLASAKINFLIWSFEASISLVIILTILITVAISFLLLIPFKIKKMLDTKNANNIKKVETGIETKEN